MLTYAATGIQPPGSTKKQTDAISGNGGAEAYANHCAICHGDNREGNLPGFPPLVGVDRRMTDEQITQIIRTGRGRMPGFPKLGQDELSALLHYLSIDDQPQPEANGSSSLAEAGGILFQQNCAFCHGRDTQGGESGPDLTQSRVVRRDRGGDQISQVVRNGRPEKKMPAFHFSDQQMHSLVAFIHEEQAKAVSKPGGRRGVEVSDLQTGNVNAGRDYFNGAGRCATCHSTTGDLAGIASKYEGLQLEQQMLYPTEARSHATVTLPSGEQVTGTVAYRDEFTIALRDTDGNYRSWAIGKVKYKLDAPVNAHVELFSQYSDDDIHNLMAYLQTLR
ncbi:MAG: c-type cytochrome [Silvibacterium sp.]|nr:c-type cytochrome [Silvibacterium sp.]